MTATEVLRSKVKARMGSHICPSCGEEHAAKVSLRDVAAATGVPASTTMRFLRGQTISSDTFDLLDAWVNEDAPR